MTAVLLFSQTLSVVPVIAEGAPPVPPVKKAYAEESVKHYNKGVELHQSGFLNQAIAEYRAAIDSDDRMEEAWSNLGGIYAAQKSYTKALEAFQKALALKPDRPTTLNGLGTVLYAKNRIEDAKKMWTQATIADPKFASAYYNMANALENEKKIPEAVQQYVRAIDVNPSMGDSFYRIATIYLKEQHAAQARVMFAKAVALGPDAEYIRDAKKQLAALDASFATDVLDHREGREVKVEPAPARGTNGTAATARPRPEAPKTTNAETPKPRVKPVKDVPVKESVTETTPPATTGGGVNITTDENGRGTVVEKTTKRKKRSHSDNVAKNRPAQAETETTTVPTSTENTATTSPSQAAPETTTTPPTRTTTTSDTTSSAAPEVAVDKQKRKRKAKMRLEDVAKTAPPPSEVESTQSAPTPGDESTANRTPETMPTQDLVPTPDNVQAGKETVATPEIPQPPVVTETSETKRSSSSDLSGMTDDQPKKKSRKREKKGHEDLARTFIVPPQDSGTEPGTPASAETSTTSPAAPAEDSNNSPSAPTAPTSAAAAEEPTAAPATGRKKKPLFSRKTKSVKDSTTYRTIEPDAGDVSDLKEKPPETAPGETTPEMMQN